jgi:hypothetical protein
MLALLFDTHGNLPALEAVLDDATVARLRGPEESNVGLPTSRGGRTDVRPVRERRRATETARVRDVAGGAPWGEVIAGRIERASMS